MSYSKQATTYLNSGGYLGRHLSFPPTATPVKGMMMMVNCTETGVIKATIICSKEIVTNKEKI